MLVTLWNYLWHWKWKHFYSGNAETRIKNAMPNKVLSLSCFAFVLNTKFVDFKDSRSGNLISFFSSLNHNSLTVRTQACSVMRMTEHIHSIPWMAVLSEWRAKLGWSTNELAESTLRHFLGEDQEQMYSRPLCTKESSRLGRDSDRWKAQQRVLGRQDSVALPLLSVAPVQQLRVPLEVRALPAGSNHEGSRRYTRTCRTPCRRMLRLVQLWSEGRERWEWVLGGVVPLRVFLARKVRIYQMHNKRPHKLERKPEKERKREKKWKIKATT